MNKSESLTSGSVTKALIRFAIPVLLANILQMVYSTTDLLIVGQFASTADVAAVSIGSQILAIITMGMSGITLGVTVLMGHRAGAQDDEGVKKAVGTGTLFFVILAFAIMIPMVVLNKSIISAMNTPPEAVQQSRDYLFWCSLGIPFIVGYNLASSMMRGLGDSKMPFVFVGFSCGVNIILDYVLIRYAHLGAAGAAIATATAQGISLVLSATYLKRRTFSFSIGLKDIRIEKDCLRRILKVGVPQAIQEVLVQFSFVIIAALVNGMGLTQAAAVGITEKLICYLMLPSISASAAVATMTAHNIGAKKPERAEKALWVGVAICEVFGIAMHVLAQFIGEPLAGIFTPDKEVAYHSALYLSTYTIDCLFTAFLFPINSYLTGCGHAMFTMAQMLASTFLVRVPVVIWMVNITNSTLRHIGIGAPASSFASVAASLIFMFWLKKKQARDGELKTL